MTNLYSDLTSTPHGLERPDRAMALGAHPDDIEFGCGGTLAKWAAAGTHVTMVVMTDGSKGTWDPDIEPAELVTVRMAEQHEAARRLGATEVVMLGHVDGELEHSMELRRQVCAEIRRHRPDVFFSHDPWQRYQLHPDHRATGMAAVDGMVAARDHLFFPDLRLAPHRPGAMLLWSADAPDHHEDIAVSFETKLHALLAHVSQGTTTMGDAHDDEENRHRFANRLRDRAAALGADVGLDLAEAFKRITP